MAMGAFRFRDEYSYQITESDEERSRRAPEWLDFQLR